jgi:hypothetical protein
LDEELDVRKEWNIADYYFCLANKVIRVPSRPHAEPFRRISPEERIMGFIVQYRAIMAVWKAARVAVDQKQADERGCEVTIEPGRFIVSDPESTVEQELSGSENSIEEESEFERIETELNDAVEDLETALKSGSEAVTSTGQALASLHQLLVEAYMDGDDKWPFVKAAKFILDVPETPSTFSDILTHRFSASLRTRES